MRDVQDCRECKDTLGPLQRLRWMNYDSLEHGIAQEGDYRCAAIVDLFFSQHIGEFILDGLVFASAHVISMIANVFCLMDSGSDL